VLEQCRQVGMVLPQISPIAPDSSSIRFNREEILQQRQTVARTN
jgi:hypothetical protein